MKTIKRLSYFMFMFVGLVVAINAVKAGDITCDFLGKDVKIDTKLTDTVHIIVLALQIVVPILLVVLGSIDFVKAITSQKEDEIKKGQKTFIARLIAGIIIFFIAAIVKLVVGLVSGDESTQLLNCADCFLNGSDSTSGCSAAKGKINDPQNNEKNTTKNNVKSTN